MLTQFVLHSEAPQYTLVEINGAHLKLVNRIETTCKVTQLRGGKGLGDNWYDEDHQTFMKHYHACMELLNKMVAAYDKPKPTTSELEDLCFEDATIEAAELVGPNSHEYDSLVESIYVERSASFLG